MPGKKKSVQVPFIEKSVFLSLVLVATMLNPYVLIIVNKF